MKNIFVIALLFLLPPLFSEYKPRTFFDVYAGDDPANFKQKIVSKIKELESFLNDLDFVELDHLAFYYYNGVGVSQDSQKADKLKKQSWAKLKTERNLHKLWQSKEFTLVEFEDLAEKITEDQSASVEKRAKACVYLGDLYSIPPNSYHLENEDFYDNKKAIEMYKRAIELNPDLILNERMNEAHRREGNNREARRYKAKTQRDNIQSLSLARRKSGFNMFGIHFDRRQVFKSVGLEANKSAYHNQDDWVNHLIKKKSSNAAKKFERDLTNLELLAITGDSEASLLMGRFLIFGEKIKYYNSKTKAVLKKIRERPGSFEKGMNFLKTSKQRHSRNASVLLNSIQAMLNQGMGIQKIIEKGRKFPVYH